MGNLHTACASCGRSFLWWSNDPDQRCGECREGQGTEQKKAREFKLWRRHVLTYWAAREKQIREWADGVAHEATTPEIGSMYPSRSSGQMKNEFRHFLIMGAQWADKHPKAGCARDQGSTQFCGEAVALQKKLAIVVVTLKKAKECICAHTCIQIYEGTAGPISHGPACIAVEEILRRIKE
jgi:hypothetical protein